MMIRVGRALMTTFISLSLIDEIASGVAPLSTPGFREAFSLNYTQAGGWVLVMITSSAFVVTAPMLLLGDKVRRKPLIVASCSLMGLLLLLVAASDSFVVVLVSLLLWGVCNDIGLSLAQATVVDIGGANRERTLAWWVFAGAVGDLLAPLMFLFLSLNGLGWRAAFALSGSLFLASALILHMIADRRWPPSHCFGLGDESLHAGLLKNFRLALRSRELLMWSLIVVLCSPLDEILLTFGALYLHDVVGLSEVDRNLVLVAFMSGAVFGAILLSPATDMLGPLTALKLAAATSSAALFGWLATSGLWTSLMFLFVFGIFATWLYPLAKAQAYALLPELSATVNAVISIVGVIDIILPIVLGIIGDRYGLSSAIGVIACIPLIISLKVASLPRF